MSHLIYEAQRLAQEHTSKNTDIEWLVLLVHRDNRRAIQFYEKCGFEIIPGVLRRNDHVVMKLWIGHAKT